MSSASPQSSSSALNTPNLDAEATPEAPDEKDIIKFTSDEYHFSMIRNLHMADFITLLNGFCGVMTIFSCMKYLISQREASYYIYRAMCCTPLGLFFDFMDGRVARLRNKSSLMGQELDSLADLISFGVGPACVAFSLGFQSNVDIVLLIVFCMCGLTRLARFNVTVSNIPKDKGGKARYFEGTPIPTTLALVATMAYWANRGWIHADLPLGVLLEGTFLEFHPAVGLFLISGSAMISKSLKIPKI
ncbi:CDP-diacylglycerol--serine O-phosphatidyltransferase [Nadsonia fulvescens var. elongata DSM 6958]|uniref:CDP-diacylglycerol--serine O-phosphatidyltransferase n=1 Tax=Nadsonia fulvescens var. elongata DSM 6958 TaxID=857566 RepID=A0A1E3PLF6_9ASCO|nr:CDP-diacylglycerol--serine O-phosphatidyltransferase [Nadsonia fulvescens var. elongata DSM 6958]